CRGLGRASAPARAPVESDRRALVYAQPEAVRIWRIGPRVMVIVAARGAFDRRERVPGVMRTVQILRWHINHVGVCRVRKNFAHVPIALDSLVFRGFFPTRSSIVGTIEAAVFFLGFQNQVNALPASSGGYRNSGPSPISRGKPVPGNLCPGDSFIGGFVESASGTK